MPDRSRVNAAVVAIGVAIVGVLVYQLGAVSGPVLCYLLVVTAAVTFTAVRPLDDPVRRHLQLAMAIVALVAAVLGYRADVGHSLFMSLTVAGLALGGIFALSGIGLVVTYRATGIFNFSHGAIAMFVAYVLWQLQRKAELPVGLAAPLALFVVGPGLGIVLDRFIFRSLQKRGAATAEKLVTTVGVLVVLIGAATLIWTAQTRTDPTRIFPDSPVHLGYLGENVVIGSDQLLIIAVSIGLTGLLALLFNRTPFGTRMRAVVDRRELAELTSVNADQVSAIAWALGSGLAGLTGVLLAPTTFGLDPRLLTLLVIETFSIAVVAKLTSVPLAVVGGLGLGVLNAYAVPFDFGRVSTALGFSDGNAEAIKAFLDPILPYLSVFLLFGALLAYKSLGATAGADEGSFVARSSIGTGEGSGRGRWVVNGFIVLALVILPFFVSARNFEDAHLMLALAIVFLSIVAITGFSGHITLGQAAFAGFGGFATARLVNGAFFGIPAVPVLVAMPIAALACIPVGLLAGYPALRRRGLFLGLTTLALGLIMERFIFQNFYFVGTSATNKVASPTLFGLDLGADRAFYFLELVILGLAVFVTHRLRSSRLGRILSAMRDSETATISVGINLRKYKLFVFSASAFIAGVGGSLITQRAGTFDGFSFLTLNGLFWFTVVVVAGVTSIYGALLGAFIFTLLGTFLGNEGLSFLIVGLAAVMMGRLPGGLVGLLQRLVTSVRTPALLERAYEAATAHANGEQPQWANVASSPTVVASRDRLEVSPAARALLAEAAKEPVETRQ